MNNAEKYRELEQSYRILVHCLTESQLRTISRCLNQRELIALIPWVESKYNINIDIDPFPIDALEEYMQHCIESAADISNCRHN